MKHIGIICAIEHELEPFLQEMSIEKTDTHAMLNFHSGQISGVFVTAVFCGVCKVNAAIAAQAMVDKYSVDAIIVSGVAGGIDPRISVGGSVIATEVCYHDVKPDILTDYHPWMPSEFIKSDARLISLCQNATRAMDSKNGIFYGRIATGECFIDQDGRDEIIDNFNPLCVDMETAGIAHVCYANKTPFIAIRSISDTGEESGEDNFAKNCDMAALQSFKIASRLLEEIAEAKEL